MKNIYSSGLISTGTIYEHDGSPCEWQWEESFIEEYGEEWNGDVRGYVENMEVPDNLIIAPDDFEMGSIRNLPQGAILLIDTDTQTPHSIFWSQDDD